MTRPRGMTLMEIMMALGIFAFGIVAIMALLATGMRAQNRSRNDANAVILAQSVLAELRGLFARGVVPEGTPPKQPAAHRDYPDFRYSVTITELTPKTPAAMKWKVGREFYVNVTVSWGPPEASKSISMDTLMALHQE